MSQSIELTILMPCLNEAETIERCIKKANQWIQMSGVSAEVLIADNGSTDGSQAMSRALGARVIDVPIRGYGAALSHGSQAAFGKFIIMGDSDDSYDFSTLDPFMEKLRAGYDLVMGNRFRGGIAPGAMPWKNRHIGNPILTSIGRLLFRCPASDFHCGIRGFSKDAFARMDLRTTGMEFASEMVIKATLFGMKIAEVPTTLAKDGRSRPPHLRPWRDGWRHLRFMMLFSPRWLFVIPGFTLAIACLLFSLALLMGPVNIGALTFDRYTLFFSMAGLIIGYMLICGGIVIRGIGIREGLLPNHAFLERLRRSPTLEVGSAAGLLLSLIGIFLGCSAVLTWGGHHFGPLATVDLFRTVAASVALIILGATTILTSLMMGFLSLPTRKDP